MIEYELGVEDLVDTRFALSPLAETMFSLWPLTDPGRHALHLPWRRSVTARLGRLDTGLLLSLVGPTRAVPDFLTPRPTTFSPSLHGELERVRGTSTQIVRRDLLAAHSPSPLPEVLRAADATGEAPVCALRDALCELLEQYWELALAPYWGQMRLVLEADMTYRARQLATGGARLLFADIHPNLSWHDGVLNIDKMIGRHRAAAAGRGLLLVPSVFAYKPVPPISAHDPPWLAYPARGVGTLWAPPAAPDTSTLTQLLGPARARLLRLLGEPVTTVELARRCGSHPAPCPSTCRCCTAQTSSHAPGTDGTCCTGGAPSATSSVKARPWPTLTDSRSPAPSSVSQSKWPAGPSRLTNGDRDARPSSRPPIEKAAGQQGRAGGGVPVDPSA